MKVEIQTKQSSKRVFHFWGNALLVIASLTVCFIVTEVVFRIIAPKQPPGTTYGKPVIINSDGLRDREFAIPKPRATYRVLVLGDSWTWGVGLDVSETIPKLLESRLSEISDFGEVEFINATIPGYNTIQQLILLREKGLRYDPDMVLLVYNLNDIEYLPSLSEKAYGDKEVTPIVEIDPGEDVTKFSVHKGFRGFVLKIEKRSVFIRFLVPRVGHLLRRLDLIDSPEFSWVEKTFQGFSDENPGWLESKRGLMEIADECRKNDCDFIVAVYPLLAGLVKPEIDEVHRTITEFCNDHGIATVDMLPIFKNKEEQSFWINFMDGHPNAAAHSMVAETLLPIMRERILSSRIESK